MKKLLFFVFLSASIITCYNLYAEDAQSTSASQPAASTETTTPITTAPVVAAPVQEAVAVAPTTPAQVMPTTETPKPQNAAESKPTTAAAPAKEAANTENLEFISGEVTAMDEAAKSITVKLYGETENDTTQKTLTVKVDETTDITDGEKDRDMKSLTSGTEVDVEYDPATNKATYIFVY